MAEIVALGRLALRQHLRLALILLSLVAVGQLTLLFAVIGRMDESMVTLATSAALLPLLSAAIATLVLFSFVQDQPIPDAATAYPRWILRAPIATWKLALTPAALKTLWVALLWSLFVVDLRYASTGGYLLTAAFSFATVAVYLTAVLWRPLRYAWLRATLLIAALPMLYGCVAFAAFQLEEGISGWWKLLSFVPLLLSYIAVLVWSVRVVALARTSPDGIVRVTATGESDDTHRDSQTGARTERRFVTASRALMWHDLRRSRSWIIRVTLFFWIPFLLLVPAFFPPLAAAIALVLVTVQASLVLSSGMVEPAHRDPYPTLPPYLAAAPIRCLTVAWARLRSTVAVSGVTTLAACLVALLVGVATPETRNAWSLEAAGLNARADVVSEISSVRLTGAAMIVIIALAIGRATASLWMSFSGRSWVGIVWGAILVALYMVPLMAGLEWFRRQTEWTEVQAAFGHAVDSLPLLIGVAIAAKMIAAVAAFAISAKCSDATLGELSRFAAGWSLAVVVVACAIALLLGMSAFKFGWCLAMTALLLPLGRLLILPAVVDWNRHR